MITEKITQELARCDDELERCQKELKKLPQGYLKCFRSKGYVIYYHVFPKRRVHLSSKNLEKIKPLARKKYLEARIADLTRERKALLAFMKNYGKKEDAVDALRNDPRYSCALSQIFPKDLMEWANQPFAGNPYHPEGLKIKCKSGLMVRSKSELLIAHALYDANIPFRYEEPLVLKNGTYYPDFTLRHPITGRTFYWEHWGLMDNAEYALRQYNKLPIFYEAGIVPFDNLIITSETAESPLNLELVYEMIEIFFKS